MQKIDRLTSQQEKLFADQRECWVKLGCSTERLDRVAAADAIGALYQALGRPRPVVLFFSSPAACLFAWAALSPVDSALLRPWWGPAACRLVKVVAFPFLSLFGSGLRLGQHWQLWRQLWSQLGWGLLGDFSDRLRDDVKSELLDLEKELADQLEEELESQVSPKLADQLWDRYDNDVDCEWQVKEGLNEDFDDLLTEAGYGCFAGAWGCGLSVFESCERIMGIGYEPARKTLMELWLKESRSCHFWFPYKGLVLASERPRVMSIDEGGELHNGQGPALEYRDGYALYAWHGLRVQSRLITDPSSITVSEIERENNTELRRVMIGRYGWARFMIDCSVQVIDRAADDHPIVGLRGAVLLRKELDKQSEPLVYLQMINSSPEPGGSRKRYLQRIDPKAYDGDAGRLCQAAMASLWHHRDDEGRLVRTFSRWQDYQPTAES